MRHTGTCKCGHSSVLHDSSDDLSAVNPRICDCDFCQQNPSAMISGPNAACAINSDNGKFTQKTNGSEQATFYHCYNCDQLLAVGAQIEGESKGAINGLLLDHSAQLGEPVFIQPRLLSAKEKAARWSVVWGRLYVDHAC